MARRFIEERGKDPDFFNKEKQKRGWSHWVKYDPDTRSDPKYTQSHATVYEQKEAVGHCVRAAYLYTAMADLAGTDEDNRLYDACRTLWDSIVHRKMYVTGGIGQTVEGEAFAQDYELPNDIAYNETCASIAMVFFAKKMLDAKPVGEYADIMERELYNGIISGIQLDGRKFFYVNPLEVVPGVSGVLAGYKHDLPERPGWYNCACCPPNLVRMITSLGSYAWSVDKDNKDMGHETADYINADPDYAEQEGAVKTDTIYSHLFIGQKAEFDNAFIMVESKYPWEGSVIYHIDGRTDKPFTLAIHIPSYIDRDSDKTVITMNGQPVDIRHGSAYMKDGYLYLTRVWSHQDMVSVSFDMPVRRVYADPRVRADAGCAAFMRGPVVYCFEGADNGNILQEISVSADAAVTTVNETAGVLAGNTLLRMQGQRGNEMSDLYSEIRPENSTVQLTAIPYYTWGNRGLNQMRVWIREAKD